MILYAWIWLLISIFADLFRDHELSGWGKALWALFIIVLPFGLFGFFGKQEVIWNELMAASFVGILPVMIIIIFLQRYLVAGLTAGAVKQ